MNLYYQTRQSDLFEYLIKRGYNISEIRNVLNKICDVIQARGDFQYSTTPESEALARWRMSDKREALSEFLRAAEFPDDVRREAIWLSEHTP